MTNITAKNTTVGIARKKAEDLSKSFPLENANTQNKGQSHSRKHEEKRAKASAKI